MTIINLSKSVIIDERIFTEFSVKFYGIHYDNNCVVAAGGDSIGFTFSCRIIDDLNGADLSIDALNTAFQTYVENNYPEPEDL
tara:strand:- start:3492 stop:3740 length:249 start_codon:yes stop_codon:yes gene_type:complete